MSPQKDSKWCHEKEYELCRLVKDRPILWHIVSFVQANGFERSGRGSLKNSARLLHLSINKIWLNYQICISYTDPCAYYLQTAAKRLLLVTMATGWDPSTQPVGKGRANASREWNGKQRPQRSGRPLVWYGLNTIHIVKRNTCFREFLPVFGVKMKRERNLPDGTVLPQRRLSDTSTKMCLIYWAF